MSLKYFKSKLLTTTLFLSAICLATKAQTNVSGGIYTNTTWSLANSPYIVVDTVVVFPGVILTIQPGVVVKFANNKQIEIRQSTLIANGTLTDSITFTSNAGLPIPGIYSGIYLHNGNFVSLEYCNFYFADKALLGNTNDSLKIKHSKFESNNIGINFYLGARSQFDSCSFLNNNTGILGSSPSIYRHCLFAHNQYGIKDCEQATIENSIIDSNSVVGIELDQKDTIRFCEIKHNAIGLKTPTPALPSIICNNYIENNSLGIEINSQNDQIFCNKICNNTSYNVKYTRTPNSNLIENNYWCTTDSGIIAGTIYDGYDDISLGLLEFMPIDTLQCYLSTEIMRDPLQKTSFTIFPNPVSDYLTISLTTNSAKTEIKIFNLLGELEYSSTSTEQNIHIDLSSLTSSIYIIEISTSNKISKQKLIKR